MAISYPDKRGRYRGAAQWEVGSGTPNENNPVKHAEATTTLAKRGRAPGEVFRSTTTEDPAVLQAQAEAEALKAQEERDGVSETGPSASSTQVLPPVSDTQPQLPEEPNTLTTLPSAI